MPAIPAITAKVLAKPPRLEGDKETRTPIKPKKIAVKASISPRIAPEVKLKMAQITARIDAMLKGAELLCCTVSVME